MNKNQRVSIVIPVYNEAEHIRACLQAVAAQTVAPYEVIVVDNNSIDDTARLVELFPFVTVLNEPRQGAVHARNRGFNVAQGDIIARLDGDSLPAQDWVASILRAFSDPDVSVLSGKVHYYDMAVPALIDRLDLYCRRRLARLLGREVAIQGANMALRRSVWRAIRHDLCNRAHLHEDFDVAIHANQRGYLVKFDESLVVNIGCRQVDYRFDVFVQYALTSPRTYAQHGLKSGRHMYPLAILVIIFFWPLKLLHRGYNVRSQRFSFQQLFTTTIQPRVSPVTFVD